MSQKKIGYSIRGYRYALESFLAYNKTASGYEKEIPLSGEQRTALGILYLTQGSKVAFDYVKRIDRERTRRCRLYMTFDFLAQEDPHTYLFCRQIKCREDATLDKRLEAFREFKDYLTQTGGNVKTGDACQLDERYRPVDVRELYLTADLKNPVVIWLKTI
jgi:hypothetical protein